jgi:hypothetical protein
MYRFVLQCPIRLVARRPELWAGGGMYPNSNYGIR